LGDRYVMLFDGRIDNRSELGDILGISTSELRSISDSAIVFRLFERWGDRAFERIVGAFVVIIMDIQDGVLLCARDHLGLRTLNYHRSSARFAVATVPEALFALSWVPRVLSKEILADTLVGRGLRGENTYYRDIFRVPPGATVQVRGSSFSKRQFWDPESTADVRFANDRDYVEAFRERFEEAVRASLRSNRPPCAMITGGLDSSSIAVVAADILAASGIKLNTFTAVPEAGFTREELRGRYFDETSYVRKIAELNPNIVPHFIEQNREPIPGKISQVIRMSGQVGGTLNCLWGVDMFAAARAAGHNVMLGGDMGNLTMSYSGHGLFTELLLTGRWLKLFHELRSSGYRWRRHLRYMVIRPVTPRPIFRKYIQWRRGQNPPWHNSSFIHPEFARQYEVFDRAARALEPFDTAPISNPRLGRIADLRIYTESVDWHAKIRANYGLDIRSPAFDRRLVEFCFGIPLNQYLHGGRDRWLIRRAMEGRLPSTVLNQSKVGMQAADWYPRLTRDRNNIAKELKRLAENPEVASIIDMQRLHAIMENWPESHPTEYTTEYGRLLAVPDALGVAYFIEDLFGANVLQSSNKVA
jgi:asparagine synthase (glutamine-hydrolysing)